jgi:hypothetical protein
MTATLDCAVRHPQPTPRRMTIPTMSDSRLAPPAMTLSMNAKFTFVFHVRYYTNSRSHAS